jgi:uncharacterized protein YkwD
MGFHVSRGFLVFTLLTMGTVGCGDSEVDPESLTEFQRDMLTAHNAVRARALPGATEALPPLKWSTEAEKVAAAWAERCTFAHNGGRGHFGENLSAATPHLWTTQEVVFDWASEAEDYDYASNTCAQGKVCGHYTQVVWRETTHVGCVVKTCTGNSPWGDEVSEWKLWVCNYAPPGNVVGEKPY